MLVSERTLAVGHRGAPMLATENTLPSIDAAIAAGADWVEVDVKLTRDQVPVLLHDRTLHRIWGVGSPVADIDLAGLPGRAARTGAGVSERCVPTLHEALDFIKGRGIRLLIDVTAGPAGAASVRLAADLGRMDEVAFTGDTEALALVRAEAPDAVITMTWESPVLPGEALFARIRPQYLNQPWILLDEMVIERVHASGRLVATYTVDDRDRMRWLAEAGVDAITSNDIAALVALLAA